MTRADIEADLAACNDQIDRAYWAFTRCARAKPPVLVVPDAYRRRAELTALLRTLPKETIP